MPKLLFLVPVDKEAKTPRRIHGVDGTQDLKSPPRRIHGVEVEPSTKSPRRIHGDVT